MDYQPMSKPSFTLCSKMVVEYERVGNLLRYKSGLWIFYKIFIFSFFSDHFVPICMTYLHKVWSHFTTRFEAISLKFAEQNSPQHLRSLVYCKGSQLKVFSLTRSGHICTHLMAISQQVRPWIEDRVSPQSMPFLVTNSTVNWSQTWPPIKAISLQVLPWIKDRREGYKGHERKMIAGQRKSNQFCINV